MSSTQPLPGTPTDQCPAIRDCGSGDCASIFLSLSARHSRGDDAQYLRWHTLDHRPEQQRLPGLRTSLRAVSTPACRRARAPGDPGFDAVDHVMAYFFAPDAELDGFRELSAALRAAGRTSFSLDPVQRDLYTVEERRAAPGVTAGADVLPWVPSRGIYLVLEAGQGDVGAAGLADVPGVAGLWSAAQRASAVGSGGSGQRLHVYFLEGDPVDVGLRLRPAVADLWRGADARVLLAAPFFCVVPYEWERYLP